MSVYRTITLGAAALALILGSLFTTPANAATVAPKPSTTASCECTSSHDSWVVTVKPPAPGTYYIQSERDRLMQKAIQKGYTAAPIGKASFVIHKICYRTAVVIYRYDASVQSIDHHDANRK